MKTEISFGSEVQDSHYNRSAVPDQGWLLHSMNQEEQLIKSAWHYFGSDSAKNNWSYTLNCLNQFLTDLPAAQLIDVNDIQKLVFMRYYRLSYSKLINPSQSDGCEGQNWSVSVFAHMVRQVNLARMNGYFQNVRSLTYLKTTGLL